MPNIKSVSALESYTSIVDELDKQKVLSHLMAKLDEAKESVRDEGTVSADDFEKELGL